MLTNANRGTAPKLTHMRVRTHTKRFELAMLLFRVAFDNCLFVR